MQNYTLKNLLPVRIGILLSLLTILYGFGLGGTFGAFEDGIKGHLKVKAENNLDSAYSGDMAKLKKITDKSWVYFKRAHLHANGLGTASLALILLLTILEISKVAKLVNSLALGIGSLGYSLFWMFAGLKAPALGSTGMAKESLSWLAIPTAGLCIAGLSMVIILFISCIYVKCCKQ